MMQQFCGTCELLARRDRDEAPLWDSILRTSFWDVAHSYNSSLLGWLVLIVRRHVERLADLTDEEAREAGMLQRQVSLALGDAVGCAKTYVAQFAEAADHPHVHFHVIPRMTGMPAEALGPNVFRNYLGASEADRVSEERMNRLAETVRASLLAMRE